MCNVRHVCRGHTVDVTYTGSCFYVDQSEKKGGVCVCVWGGGGGGEHCMVI